MKRQDVCGWLLLTLVAFLPGCIRGPEDHIVTPPTAGGLRDKGIPDTANRANKRGNDPNRPPPR
jgi:hypothetical protein